MDEADDEGDVAVDGVDADTSAAFGLVVLVFVVVLVCAADVAFESVDATDDVVCPPFCANRVDDDDDEESVDGDKDDVDVELIELFCGATGGVCGTTGVAVVGTGVFTVVVVVVVVGKVFC